MEHSKILLKYAINALSETTIKPNQWSIGGGTVLATYYNHRLSKDIDVFISDAQFLSELSPRFNEECYTALDYNEMANYISLSYIEGKVDFIVAGQLTKFPPSLQNFFGELVMLDDSVEIVAKKLYFRNDYILPRDIFDLAVVYSSERQKDLVDFALSIPDKMKTFIKNFEKNKEVLSEREYSILYWDAVLDGGKQFVGKEFEICQEFINVIKERIK